MDLYGQNLLWAGSSAFIITFTIKNFLEISNEFRPFFYAYHQSDNFGNWKWLEKSIMNSTIVWKICPCLELSAAFADESNMKIVKEESFKIGKVQGYL